MAAMTSHCRLRGSYPRWLYNVLSPGPCRYRQRMSQSAGCLYARPAFCDNEDNNYCGEHLPRMMEVDHQHNRILFIRSRHEAGDAENG